MDGEATEPDRHGDRDQQRRPCGDLPCGDGIADQDPGRDYRGDVCREQDQCHLAPCEQLSGADAVPFDMIPPAAAKPQQPGDINGHAA